MRERPALQQHVLCHGPRHLGRLLRPPRVRPRPPPPDPSISRSGAGSGRVSRRGRGGGVDRFTPFQCHPVPVSMPPQWFERVQPPNGETQWNHTPGTPPEAPNPSPSGVQRWPAGRLFNGFMADFTYRRAFLITQVRLWARSLREANHAGLKDRATMLHAPMYWVGYECVCNRSGDPICMSFRTPGNIWLHGSSVRWPSYCTPRPSGSQLVYLLHD